MSDRQAADKPLVLVGTSFGSLLGFCKTPISESNWSLALTHAVFIQENNMFIPVGGLDALALDTKELEEVVTYVHPDSYLLATFFPQSSKSPLVKKFLQYWSPQEEEGPLP